MKQEIGSGYHRGSKTVQENRYLTFIAPTKKDKNGGRQRVKRDPDAMEVDTTEIGKTSFKRMDPKEMQHTMIFGPASTTTRRKDLPKEILPRLKGGEQAFHPGNGSQILGQVNQR